MVHQGIRCPDDQSGTSGFEIGMRVCQIEWPASLADLQRLDRCEIQTAPIGAAGQHIELGLKETPAPGKIMSGLAARGQSVVESSHFSSV